MVGIKNTVGSSWLDITIKKEAACITIDEAVEQIKGTAGAQGGHYLYTIYVTGSYVPSDGYALICIVCTK